MRCLNTSLRRNTRRRSKHPQSFNETLSSTQKGVLKHSLFTVYTTELWPILSQISLSWQPGMVLLKFDWHHWIAWSQKPPVIHKDLLDILYTNRVIDDFVPNFVAMATGVGHGRICLALFHSPTPKTPCYTQRSRGYLLYKPSYSRFCLKFRCHANGGWSW